MQQFWKRYALRNEPWNKKWYLVNLEFREENKANRSTILEKLHQLGFGILSANTWICPYCQTDELQKISTEFNMNTGVVEMNGEMTINEDMISFVDKV
ncbi:hypothetical protein [Desulfosporosinus sp.]|uniref:hypothetical protein n=1 Tax=Desulfosporosinus sp. TaxID=157907 RepID=UPI0023168113|nr:hypothetical protein [Desulfosporosinus sp.]MCO5388327.1 hypothetical protein [Desulfosporosinus sp.]MDA8221085.1 hypothetical protein [Desulfitobacterium hafniense]